MQEQHSTEEEVQELQEAVEIDGEQPQAQAVQLNLPILKFIKSSQQQNGLRHGDYMRYRQYCARRIERIRKTLKLQQGDRRHFKRKDVTAVMLKDERHLHIILVDAERAWSYAMQLKQEAQNDQRKTYHMRGRLYKAVERAEQLEKLCQSPVCDARSKLESQAYVNWLRGLYEFERENWREAQEFFRTAKIIYEKLASVLPDDESPLYHQKVEELTPTLRYCAYKVGEKSAKDDLIKMRGVGAGEIGELDELIAQTRQEEAANIVEVTWRGRNVPVRQEKVRMVLLALQDFDKNLEEATTAEAKIATFDSLLMNIKDSIQLLRDELAANPALQRKGDGPVSSVLYLLSYLTYVRITKTVERNLLIIEGLRANLSVPETDGRKSSKPQDLVRLYDGILQHLGEMRNLSGLEDDQEFMREIEGQEVSMKFFRVCYIGLTFEQTKRWKEALALYEKADSYSRQVQNYSHVVSPKILKEVKDLALQISSSKYRIHAESVLQTDVLTNGVASLAVKERPPLSSRLDDFVEEAIVSPGKPNIVQFPPSMEPAPCKPLFFDLALNYVEFPDLQDKMEAKKSQGGIGGFVKGLWGWSGKK